MTFGLNRSRTGSLQSRNISSICCISGLPKNDRTQALASATLRFTFLSDTHPLLSPFARAPSARTPSLSSCYSTTLSSHRRAMHCLSCALHFMRLARYLVGIDHKPIYGATLHCNLLRLALVHPPYQASISVVPESYEESHTSHEGRSTWFTCTKQIAPTYITHSKSRGEISLNLSVLSLTQI